MTLRWRLTLAFVVVVLVPLMVGAALLARALPHAVQQRQQAGMVSNARLAAQVLRSYCDRAETAAEAAGRAVTPADAAGARVAAQSLVDRGLVDGIRVTGPTGAVVAQAGQVPADPVGCGSEAQRTSAVPAISALVRLTGPAQRPAGTSVASFTVDTALARRLAAGLDDDIVLVDPSGQVAAATTPVPADIVRAALRHPGALVGGRTTALVAAAPGRPYGVLLLQATAVGPDLTLAVGLVALLALLLAGGIAFVFARITAGPLEELGVAAARVASGDLSTTIPVRSRDEVGRLAAAFNTMTDDLRGYVGQLEQDRDELQAGLARLGDTLSGTHDLDRILSVVIESAMASTRASGGLVLLLSPSGEELVLAASRGLDLPVDLRLPVEQGLSGQVATTGEAVRGRLGEGQLVGAAGEPQDTSVIAVPLTSSGRVIGVLDLFGSALPGGFDGRDLATIRTFASQATVAVDNVLLHEEAQRLSVTDGLTGLWNYRYFTMMIGKEIERATRFSRPLSLLLLDLDHFKAVNDTFGHQRGDRVLIELASRIRAEVRDVDTVARYGGEEIVVILPETDEPGARLTAERLCQAIRQRSFGEPPEPPVVLTVSIGVAVFPLHGAAAGALLGRADEALYDAKRSGRDTWRLAPLSGARD